jgi:hypothetical protein
MRCQRCGRPISPLRQLTDREFCCDDHRRRGRLPSASVLRDLEHERDPFWEALHGNGQQKTAARANTSLGAVLVLGVGLIVAARFWFPADGGPPAVAQIIDTAPKIGAQAERGTSTVMRWLNGVLPGDKPVIAKDDFKSGLTDWLNTAGEKLARDGMMPSNRLMLWKPTIHSANYDVEFEGAIQNKAMSWAFRATDPQNYYATKLILRKAGDPSSAAIQRMVVLNNKVIKLGSELPLPIKIEREKSYQIALTVEGNRFTTRINGSKVDEWSDRQQRHKTGGVGFFSDEGESASIAWVRFVEHKGLLSRLLAAQMLFLPPGMPDDLELE